VLALRSQPPLNPKEIQMKITTATRVAALAVGLSLAGASAFAAPRDGPGRHQGDNAPAAAQEKPTDQNAGDAKKHGNRTHGTAPAVKPATPAAPQATAPNRRNRSQAAAQVKRNRNQAVQSDSRRGRGVDNNRNRRHVDVQQYRRNLNAPRRYRVENYRWRKGYSYRRYGYGQRLPRNYYGRDFWLTNFFFYGLFAPPDGYIWVRYGPDALLIDEYTGEIVQVRYNMFYS
jgi:Ni/Co efflux regulator RcnB